MEIPFKSQFELVLKKFHEQRFVQKSIEFWEQLESEQKQTIQLMCFFFFLGLGWIFMIQLSFQAYRLKKNFLEKDIATLEMNELKNILNQETTNKTSPPPTEFSQLKSLIYQLASAINLDTKNVIIEKTLDAQQTNSYIEYIQSVQLNRVNLKQLIDFINQLQEQKFILQLTNLKINTHKDLSGYIDATIVFSFFEIKLS